MHGLLRYNQSEWLGLLMLICISLLSVNLHKIIKHFIKINLVLYLYLLSINSHKQYDNAY